VEGRQAENAISGKGAVRGQEAARSLSWGGRNPHGPISHLPRLLPAAHSNRREQLIVALLLCTALILQKAGSSGGCSGEIARALAGREVDTIRFLQAPKLQGPSTPPPPPPPLHVRGQCVSECNY
jgi:hypothetical protein